MSWIPGIWAPWSLIKKIAVLSSKYFSRIISRNFAKGSSIYFTTSKVPSCASPKQILKNFLSFLYASRNCKIYSNSYSKKSFPYKHFLKKEFFPLVIDIFLFYL